jgi:protein involved in polysaccharide export with SLBB domain
VEDIIEFAGGLTKEASNQSKIVSRSSKGELFSFNADETSLVEKGDRIFVPFKKFKANDLLIDRDYQFLDDPVEISGAVSSPGLYYLNHSSKMSDLILEAGGFTSDAYIFGGVLINKEAKLKESQYNKKLYDEAIKSLASISHSSKNTDISKLLPVLSEFKDTEASGRIISEFDIFKLKKNPTLDTSISPGDKIYIPYKSNVVHVFGEVLNTGSVTYSTGMKVSDYINASGGLNDAADKRRIILVQANGKAIRVNLRGNIFSSTSEEILPGAVIYVSRDMRNIEGLDLAMTISPIISSLAISLASINSINKN